MWTKFLNMQFFLVFLLSIASIEASLTTYGTHAYIAPYASTYNAHQIAHSVAYPVAPAPVIHAPAPVTFAAAPAPVKFHYAALPVAFAAPVAPVAAPVAPVAAPVAPVAAPAQLAFGAPIHTHTYTVTSGAIPFSAHKFSAPRFGYALPGRYC